MKTTTKPSIKKPLQTKMIDCSTCDGQGRSYSDIDEGWGRCPTCGGKGIRHLGNDGEFYAGPINTPKG